MSGKPVFTVGFVREWGARYSLASQRAAMRKFEIKRVYDDRALLIRQRRPGDAVAVAWLHLLTDPARKYRRADLMGAIQSLEEKGAHIWELGSGLKSNKRGERDTMLVNAYEALALGRVPKKGGKIGRPRREWTEPDVTTLRLHWYSNRHRTDALAVAAMRADGVKNITPSIVRKLLGNSGRRRS